jgi:hypothetical protein
VTIEEIMERRLERVRLAEWNSDMYVKIDFMDDGTYSPWVFLVSPKEQKALGITVGSQRLLWEETFQDDDADWEPYRGVPVYGF